MNDDKCDNTSVANKTLSQAHPSQPSVCQWRGLRNLSNTCYLNSVLQLLFGVAPVRRAILYDALMNEQACKNKLHKSTIASSTITTITTTNTITNCQNDNNDSAAIINNESSKNNKSFTSSCIDTSSKDNDNDHNNIVECT